MSSLALVQTKIVKSADSNWPSISWEFCRSTLSGVLLYALAQTALITKYPVIIPGRWISISLRPLSVKLQPRPSVTDFLKARWSLRQEAVHILLLGIHAAFLIIFHKKYVENSHHDDSGFVPALNVFASRILGP